MPENEEKYTSKEPPPGLPLISQINQLRIYGSLKIDYLNIILAGQNMI